MDIRIQNRLLKAYLVAQVVFLTGFSYHNPLDAIEARNKVSVTSDYLSSNSNFDDEGESVDLGAPQEFSHIGLEGQFDYYFRNKISVFGGVDFGWSESTTLTEDRSRFALTDLNFGGRYALVSRNIVFEPAIKVSFPLASDGLDTDEVFVNDGVSAISPGAYLGMDLGVFEPFSYIGYTLRGDGRSNLIEYFVDLRFRFSSFHLDIFVSGFDSATDDEDTGAATSRLLTISRVNSGSLIFDSVNPGVTFIGAGGGISINKTFGLSLNYEIPIQGFRYAEYSRLSALLDISFGAKEESGSFEYQRSYDQPKNYPEDKFELQETEAEKLFEEATKQSD